MAPLRVGIDLSPLDYGNRVRGIGIYAQNLVSALAELDHETHYFLLTTDRDSAKQWHATLPDNFQWHVIPSLPLGRAAPLISHQVVLPFQVRKLELDVLHCIDLPTNPSHPGIPFWQSTRTVVTVHDLTPLVMGPGLVRQWRHRAFYDYQLRACRRAAHLICDSHSTASDVARFGLADKEKVSVIHLASPPFEDASTSGKKGVVPGPYILHVGGADPQKNQDSVLKAFDVLCRDPDFQHRLVLVGNHHLDAEIESESGRRIMRLTNLDRAELHALYKGADVFVFPSLYEGFGLPVLEAMSCGVPVVTSRASALPEVAGAAALLIDPANPLELADAVRRLVSERALREQCVEAGYCRVQQFSWSETARRTREVYERVGKRNGHGSTR